ncbi:phosphodiester glycosidase family protein [Rhodobacter sp. TJ_12]|uniref:phosphodiester glycosidase family protein n=1 Tax=Rhodobacter sp. TJ_12 TaxID=2029399 RepID=UPI001CBBBDB1|nr:phosphodiester glycosidase family protein [Rhodobacter sp. TJ_12]
MKTLWASLFAALALIVPRAALAADPCRTVTFEDTPFTVCEARAGDDVRVWLRDGAGGILGTIPRVKATLAPGERLVFAMNAGMYAPDRSPAGLYIENGQELHRIITNEGPGNFGMLPNGVFCISDRFAVVESRAFAANPPGCRYATQSGPMLVIDGALHPRFLPDSDSTYIRNGVGVSGDGLTAWFVIADKPVNFHRFARFFRDELGAPNALYLDGSISRLFVPAQGRADFGLPMGPIVGLVAHDQAPD